MAHFISTTVRTGHRCRHRGVAAVEFALLIIPLILLFAGVAEFGRALMQYNSLTKSVRDSARFLSIQNPANDNYPAAAARCLAVFGNRTCTGTPLVPGLTTAMVTICNPLTPAADDDCDGPYNAVETGLGTINLVEVRIQGYNFQAFLPGLTQLNSFVFDDISTTMRQVL